MCWVLRGELRAAIWVGMVVRQQNSKVVRRSFDGMGQGTMNAHRRGPLPPVLFLGALLVQWAAHAFLPIAVVLPGTWGWLGTIPIVVGIVVMVVSNRQFQAVGTVINPFDTPSSLVISGPFRFSRNPMYLAMLLILIGGALGWGSVTPFLVPPIMAWLLATRFIGVEEAALSKVFGADYDEYKGRVRRWL